MSLTIYLTALFLDAIRQAEPGAGQRGCGVDAGRPAAALPVQPGLQFFATACLEHDFAVDDSLPGSAGRWKSSCLSRPHRRP